MICAVFYVWFIALTPCFKLTSFLHWLTSINNGVCAAELFTIKHPCKISVTVNNTGLSWVDQSSGECWLTCACRCVTAHRLQWQRQHRRQHCWQHCRHCQHRYHQQHVRLWLSFSNVLYTEWCGCVCEYKYLQVWYCSLYMLEVFVWYLANISMAHSHLLPTHCWNSL